MEPVVVVLRQPDIEREGRHLLGLEDRELRKRSPLPLDAVQEELVPLPVGRLAAAIEERAEDRQVEGLVDLGDAEPQRRLQVRDEGRDLLALAGVPGPLARHDLLGRQSARGADFHGGLRFAAGPGGGLEHDGERALGEIERQRLAPLQVEALLTPLARFSTDAFE